MDRTRLNLVRAVVIGGLLATLGCSSEEPANQAPPASAPAQGQPAQAAPPTVAPHVDRKETMDSLRGKAEGATKPYIPRPGLPTYDPTPCERKEPGWKWRGGVVRDGQCVVGPCECIEAK